MAPIWMRPSATRLASRTDWGRRRRSRAGRRCRARTHPDARAVTAPIAPCAGRALVPDRGRPAPVPEVGLLLVVAFRQTLSPGSSSACSSSPTSPAATGGRAPTARPVRARPAAALQRIPTRVHRRASDWRWNNYDIITKRSATRSAAKGPRGGGPIQVGHDGGSWRRACRPTVGTHRHPPVRGLLRTSSAGWPTRSAARRSCCSPCSPSSSCPARCARSASPSSCR